MRARSADRGTSLFITGKVVDVEGAPAADAVLSTHGTPTQRRPRMR
ncbi:hypothetical protein [Streptomyces sp. LN785]